MAVFILMAGSFIILLIGYLIIDAFQYPEDAIIGHLASYRRVDDPLKLSKAKAHDDT